MNLKLDPQFALDLNKSKYAVLDDFLDSIQVSSLLYELEAEEDEGEYDEDFEEDGGDESVLEVSYSTKTQRAMRKNKIFWQEDDFGEDVDHLQQKLLSLVRQLNSSHGFSYKLIEARLGIYEPGELIRKSDEVEAGTKKYNTVSFVIYLNSDWDEEDGGQLRLFLAKDSAEEIDPVAGRLVFVGDDLDYEISEVNRRRLGVTGVLLDRR